MPTFIGGGGGGGSGGDVDVVDFSVLSVFVSVHDFQVGAQFADSNLIAWLFAAETNRRKRTSRFIETSFKSQH